MSQLNAFDGDWDPDATAENALEEAFSDPVEAVPSLPCDTNATDRWQARRLIEQHLEEKRLRAGLCDVFDEPEDDYQLG